MDAYTPSSVGLAAMVALLACAAVAAAVLLSRLPAPAWGRPLAWLLVVVTVVATHLLTRGEAAGVRMLALVWVGLAAMKAPVLVEARTAGQPPLSGWRALGFAAAWFGMQPRVFAVRSPRARESATPLAIRGLLRLSLGVAFVVAARALRAGAPGSLPATVLFCVGASLIVHFGIFNVVAAAWRCAGVPCGPLFRAPLRATTLAEFWGRRWNLAFAEMTALAVFRPLRARIGHSAALTAAFLFSGVLHEMAISLPVRAGYGLPLAYFALHAIALRLEQLPALAAHLRGWRGRSWVLVWLLAPLPLLFHAPFLVGVVEPLLGGGAVRR